jgi:hypothetical protein
VRNFAGSYDEWSRAGKPVERAAISKEAVPAD